MTLSIKEIGAIAPLGFFNLSFSLHRELSELPVTHFLLDELPLCKFKMSYSDERLQFSVTQKNNWVEEDRLHLFIDTRDLKDRGVPHRYCHHFVISIQGGEEATRFRGEEARKIADPFSVAFKGKTLEGELSELYGFNPKECQRIGFTYLFEREDGQKQHFALSSRDYNIEQHPDLWASGTLVP